MKGKRLLLVTGFVFLALITAALMTACGGSSSGYTRTHMHYGAGYRGYYNDPWRYGPGYIDGGPDIGHEPPIAEQLPEMGMPDYGGMDMDMDMGGFDF